jgi:hypothetical protein
MKIIAANRHGLCNRLKAIATVARLTGEFRVYWEVHPNLLNCAINDLFEIKPFIVEEKPLPIGSKVYLSWRLGVLASDGVPEGFSSFGESVGGVRLIFNDPLRRNIDNEFSRIPKSLIEIYVKIFEKIQPKPDLVEKINSFSSKFDENTVSMNIRSWNDDPHRNKEFFSIDAYIEEMKKFPKQTNFYVSSDSLEVKNSLFEIFPNRILCFPRKTELATSRHSKEGMQEDLIELYLVSKNKVIIGSYLSTFTEVAWWLGGAKAKVILPLPNKILVYQ